MWRCRSRSCKLGLLIVLLSTTGVGLVVWCWRLLAGQPFSPHHWVLSRTNRTESAGKGSCPGSSPAPATSFLPPGDLSVAFDLMFGSAALAYARAGGGSLLQLAEYARQEKRRRLFGDPGNTTKVRMLFLTRYSYYHHMMDRHHYFFWEAAARHPYVQTDLWGTGFPDWDSQLTAEQNIVAKYGRVDSWDILQTWPPVNFSSSERLLQHAVVAYREHECWQRRCLPWQPEAGIRLFTFPYEMLQFLTADDIGPRVFAHSPAAADPRLFFGTDGGPTSARDIDVLLVGARGCDPPIYPLRQRIYDLIMAGNISGHIQQHPGYNIHLTVEEAEAKGLNPETVRRQVEEYAALLRRAKIVIGDSSVFKYGLQKLAEIAAAGALLFSDVPLEREPEFRQFVVEVDPAMSDAELVSLVQRWLADVDARERRARYGQWVALSQWTWDDNVDALISAWQDYRAGRYGMRFFHPFSVGCAVIGRDSRVACKYDYSPWCLPRTAAVPPP